MTKAYIYDHVRTPRGKDRADGALNEITPLQLGTQVLGAARARGQKLKRAGRRFGGGFYDYPPACAG